MNKKRRVLEYVIIALAAIILSPILLVVAVVFLLYIAVCCLLGRKHIKKPRLYQLHLIRQEEKKTMPDEKKQFRYPYISVEDKLPEAVFLERFSEFTCIQFQSVNGLSNRRIMREYIVSENPALKEKILNFVKEYPMEQFLHGNLYGEGCDLDHWSLDILFEDPRLNRRINGYGHTECAGPYLTGLAYSLPEVLSEEEKRQAKIREELEKLRQFDWSQGVV